MARRKKLTSLFVAVMLLLGCITPMSSFAAETVVKFSEGFNASATNAQAPNTVAVGGGSNNGVVEVGKENKAFMLGLNQSSGTLTIPYSASSGTVWFGARFRINGYVESGALFQIIDSAGTKLNLINMTGYRASLCDGKYFAKMRKSVWTDVHVKLDYTNKSYSIYVDGERIYENWGIRTTLPSMAKLGFEFANVSSDATIEFDHIAIYTGDKPLATYPKQEYNAEVVEADTSGANAIPRLFLWDDFNNFGSNSHSGSSTPKGNIIDIRNEQGHTEYHEGDTMYLHLEQTIANDGFYEIYMSYFDRTNYVVDTIMNLKELNNTRFNFQLRDDYSGVGQWALMSAEENGVLKVAGNVFNNIDFGEWTRVSFVVDQTMASFDVYVNGVLVRTGCKWPSSPSNVDRIRVTLGPGTGSGIFGLDAIAVYEGTELKPSLEMEHYEENIINGYDFDDKEVQEFLAGKRVYCATNSSYYANGEKTEFPARAYETSTGVIMSPIEPMAATGGVTMQYNEETGTITLSNGYTLTVGSDKFVKDGVSTTAQSKVEVKDGIPYAPLLSFFRTIMGNTVSYHDLWQLAFLTNDGSTVPTTDAMLMKKVMHLMIYERMSGEEMKKRVTERFPNNGHPRLGFTKERIEEVKKNIQTDEGAQKLYDILKMTVDGYGGPTLYEPQGDGGIPLARTREEKMENIGVMWHLTGDRKYADMGIAQLEATTSMPTMGYGNHLNIGAIMESLALGYDYFYDVLSDELRTKIKECIMEMWKNEAFLKSDAGGNGPNLIHRHYSNFTMVHNSPYVTSALCLIDEPEMEEMAKHMFEVEKRSMEYGLENYAPYGAWPEGFGYWKYTLLELAPCLKSMMNCLGTTLGFEKHRGFPEATFFALDVSGISRMNPYHDAGKGEIKRSRAAINEQSACIYLLSQLFDPGFTAAWMTRIDAVGPSNAGHSLVWYYPEYMTAESNSTLDHEYPGDLEYVAMRSSMTDENAIYLAFHSGENYMAHAHPDGGTWVMDALGYNWITECGTEDYMSFTDVDPRLGIYYRVRAEAHNVYIINPREGHLGQKVDGIGSTTQFNSMERGGYATVDMSDYYPDDTVSATRGFKLAGDRSYAVVRDEISLKGYSEVLSFMHTQADIKILDNRRAILGQYGKQVLVEVDTNGSDVVLEDRPAEMLPTSPVNSPNARNNDAYRKLTVKLNASGNLYINIKITPLYEEITSTQPDNEYISLWANQEGSLQTPRLNNVFADGVPVEGFAPTNSQITVNLPAGTKVAPTITATADEKYTVEIRQNPNDLFADGLIKLVNKEDPSLVGYYVIRYEITPEKLENIEGMNLLPISAITHMNGADLKPVLTDGDLATERHEDYQGQKYTIDLGSVQNFDSIIMAFNVISEVQRHYFDLEYSVDGENWTLKPLMETLQGSGYQRLTLGENINARYLRLTVNGRTAGDISRLCEFAVIGK